MKVLVTGAKGFIGKNLVADLENEGNTIIYEYDQDSAPSLLDIYCREADFVFHLAGVNRPREEKDYMEGNSGFTSLLLDKLAEFHNRCPVMFSSSIQAALDNPYGVSKKSGEDLMFRHGRETGARIMVYRFPNVFGKWCRPNYNSVVATFCHNIARGLQVRINDPDAIMSLVYIDDVVKELNNALHGKENRVGVFCEVPVVHSASLGEIAELLYSFGHNREDLSVPNLADQFIKKLYSTYLSYLPDDKFSYMLKMNMDHRGSFTEFIKTADRGQVSVNISKPGIVKGNHWHHSKNEKFLVVSGYGVIRLRKIGSKDIVEYVVDGDRLEVVDIPPGYTHQIENLGKTDMVTVMWANEIFDPEEPDTYYLEV